MNAWSFLPIGYLTSIALETPVLLVGLSRRHSWRRRLFAGVWLTACTYPIVVLSLPVLISDRTTYIAVAESFAAVGECALFYAAFGDGRRWNDHSLWRDCTAVVAANLASFLIGSWLLGIAG